MTDNLSPPETPEWHDDLKCGVCGNPVGENGVKIHYVSLVIPREPELYAWCSKHSPTTKEEEEELWKSVKRGEKREQAQSWKDY